MDLFLIQCIALLWVSIAVARHPFAAGQVPRLLIAALAGLWLLLAGMWAGDLMRLVAAPPAPPPLRPVRSADPLPEIKTAEAAATPSLLFRADLIGSTGPAGWAVDGLFPAIDSRPDLNLPRLRSATGSVVRLRLPAQPGLQRLRVSLSARLHQRNRAVLAVFFNGTQVREFRLGGATTWLDAAVEVAPAPGENVIELRDAPLHDEPDWADYLERYPDVRRNLVSLHIPLEAGAQAHYEAAGRPEGRTLRLIAMLPPEPDSYTFLFRQLRVEGFKGP